MDALCSQASFVDQLCPNDVWQRTLILCKEARNPEEQTAGAREAVRRMCKDKDNDHNDDIKVVGFTYLHSAKSLSQEQKDFAK